jgi:hypothetical protein
MNTLLQTRHILTHICATNASMASNFEEVTESDNDLLDLLGQFTGWGQNQGLRHMLFSVNLLKDRDREGGGLASAGLRLRNNVVTLDDRHDGALLNGGWTLEAIGIDTAQ